MMMEIQTTTVRIQLPEAAVSAADHDAAAQALADALAPAPSPVRPRAKAGPGARRLASALPAFALADAPSANLAPASEDGARGTPRGAMTVPVSPEVGAQGELNDTFLLESPDGEKTFFVPRYRVAVVEVNGGRQKHYRAALERRGAEWRFTVRLQAYAADELGDRAWSAMPLAGPYAVRLTGGGRSFDFQDVFVEEDGLRAVLTLGDVAEHDALFDLLTHPERGGRLEVARRVAVGLPAELADPRDPLRVELARLRRMRPARFRQANPGWEPGYLGVDPPSSFRHHPPGEAPERTTFLLENLSRDGEPHTGDVIALHTVDGGTLTGARDAYPHDGVTAQVAVPTREQRILLRGFQSWQPDSPVNSNRRLYEDRGTLVGFGRPLPVNLSSLGLPIDDHANTENWSIGTYVHGYFVEEAPASSPLHAYLRSRIEAVEREIAAARKVFSTTHFVAATVDLPWTAAPAPFAFDAQRHAYVYAGVPTRQDPGLVRVQVGASVYHQEERSPNRFHYLPDRFALEVLPGPPARPALAIRPTVDASTFLVEYTAVPVVDAERLRGDADALLAHANRGADRPFDAVELVPLLGDEPSVSLVVPRASGPDPRKRLSRPGALANLAARLADAFAVSAEELQELFDALHSGGESPLFTGTVTLAMGDQNDEIPLAIRLPGEPTALWNAVFSREVPARYLREVEVAGSPALFADAGVLKVTVTFDRGGEVVLTPERTSAVAQVSLPVDDFILRRDDAGEFRYRVSATRADGGETPGEWRTARGSLVRPQLP